MSEGVHRGGEGLDPLAGRFEVGSQLVPPDEQQDVFRPECDRRDAVADHIQPYQFPLFCHGIRSGQKQIGQQGLPSGQEIFGAFFRRVESVDQRAPVVLPDDVQDSAAVHGARIGITYRAGSQLFDDLRRRVCRIFDPVYDDCRESVFSQRFRTTFQACQPVFFGWIHVFRILVSDPGTIRTLQC